jgi:hypothetical protein
MTDKADKAEKKFNAKKNVPWDKFDPTNMNFTKAETKAVPGGEQGDYTDMNFDYEYSADEHGELRIKWPDLVNCWISKFVDKKKDNKETWSITHYYNAGDDDAFDGFIKNLTDGHLAIIDNNKKELEARYEDLEDQNFNPENGKPSPLWEGLSRRTKGAPKDSKKRKTKFKCPFGAKPDVRRSCTDDEVKKEVLALMEKGMTKVEAQKAAQKKTRPMDADFLDKKKCTLRIVSRHPKIYCGQKIYPQQLLYSCLVLDLDESGKAPDDLFEDDVDDLFVTQSENTKKAANKLAALEAGGKPKQEASKKDEEKDEKKSEGKGFSGVKNTMASLKEKAAASKTEKKDTETKAESKKEVKAEKKKPSPKATDDDSS